MDRYHTNSCSIGLAYLWLSENQEHVHPQSKNMRGRIEQERGIQKIIAGFK
jgi:hypothetical protein